VMIHWITLNFTARTHESPRRVSYPDTSRSEDLGPNLFRSLRFWSPISNTALPSLTDTTQQTLTNTYCTLNTRRCSRLSIHLCE